MPRTSTPVNSAQVGKWGKKRVDQAFASSKAALELAAADFAILNARKSEFTSVQPVSAVPVAVTPANRGVTISEHGVVTFHANGLVLMPHGVFRPQEEVFVDSRGSLDMHPLLDNQLPNLVFLSDRENEVDSFCVRQAIWKIVLLHWVKLRR